MAQRQVPGSKIFPVGSFPLKTYLPYADVDMVMFSPRSGSSNGSVGDALGEIGAGNPGYEGGESRELGNTTNIHPDDDEEIVGGVRTPALVAVNYALCSVAASAGSRRGPRPQKGCWPSNGVLQKPEIRNVTFVNARTPIVTMVVGNVVVDLTENQGGSVAASALLEEADNQIQRNHLFKRSLLLLKAWAWCETPRLAGKRVLGAQQGGLTSYGFSVMVLHLFASQASADDLVQPLDVFIRFFEVYSDFDWGRYCLTLDGPVPFGFVRQSRPGEVSKDDSKNSRLQPLVKRVLAELSPGVKKEKDKTARRGRRASRFGQSSDGRGEHSSTSGAEASGSLGTSPHFPRRDCNIQDPLNALNNLGHSVTKESLKALQRALQQGRKQLEAWKLLPRSVWPNSPPSDDPLQRPSKTGVAQPEPSPGVRSAEDKYDTGRSEAGAGVGNGKRAPSPEPAPPVVEQFPSARTFHQFGLPAQYMLLPSPHAAHPGLGINTGPPQHVWVPDTQGQPIVLAFPQPFLQAVPHQYQIVHQPPPYMVPQGQPGMQRPFSAGMMPVPRIQAHPSLSSPFQLQRVLPVTYQRDHQFGPDRQLISGTNVLPEGWRDQATNHSEVYKADPMLEERHKSAPRASKSEGSTTENESFNGRRRKGPEELRDPAMQGSISPWDLGAFVNASATSSTASLSDMVDYGSKDGQDGQFQSEIGADDEVQGGPGKATLFVSSCDGSVHSDTMVDIQHREGAMEVSSGKLWASRFLREVFPECCHRYGSGDGFREDLLDHPCQRKSKLQEAGAPLSRLHGGPDVLQGNSRDLWNSLTTVGEIMREAGPQPNQRNVKEAETTLENDQEAIGADRDGQDGRNGAEDVCVHVGNEAGNGRRATQVGRMDAVSPAYSGNDCPAPSTNAGSDAQEVDMLRPQRGDGDEPNADKVSAGEFVSGRVAVPNGFLQLCCSRCVDVRHWFDVLLQDP